MHSAGLSDHVELRRLAAAVAAAPLVGIGERDRTVIVAALQCLARSAEQSRAAAHARRAAAIEALLVDDFANGSARARCRAVKAAIDAYARARWSADRKLRACPHPPDSLHGRCFAVLVGFRRPPSLATIRRALAGSTF